MKKDKLIEKILAGGIFAVGEFRTSKAEKVDYKDKVTGKSASFSYLLHGIETGNEVFNLRERLPDGAKVDGYVAPFKKGQMVVVAVTGMQRKAGLLTGEGEVQILENT